MLYGAANAIGFIQHKRLFDYGKTWGGDCQISPPDISDGNRSHGELQGGKGIFSGEWMRARRMERGMTQEALAREAGVTRQFINNIEAGRKSPSLRTASKIAAALGVSEATMWAPEPEAPDPTRRWETMSAEELITELMANIRELTTAVREQKEVELERIRLVDGPRAKGDADLKFANRIAQETLRGVLAKHGFEIASLGGDRDE